MKELLRIALGIVAIVGFGLAYDAVFTTPVLPGDVWLYDENYGDNDPFHGHTFQTNTVLQVSNGYALYSTPLWFSTNAYTDSWQVHMVRYHSKLLRRAAAPLEQK